MTKQIVSSLFSAPGLERSVLSKYDLPDQGRSSLPDRRTQRHLCSLRSAITSILPTSGPQYGFCHGDHHGGNVHRDANGKLVLFDFDCYGYGWRAYDLAVILWQLTHSFGWSRAGRGKIDRRWNGFLNGYGDIRHLKKAELMATELFVPVRQIWWLGLHTYMRSREVWGGTLDDGFFDGHLGYVRKSAERCGL